MKINITVKPGTTAKIKTGNWRELCQPKIDHEKCNGCTLCGHICPEGICFPSGQKNMVGKIFYELDLDYCKGCGLCAEICPVKAIIMIEENK
ncbi:MAG TPA: 4Fe-4S binding protein [Patescibacteria group bacterium]|nr:4Fe-4S binding protein [Patescibacteria group bacterium]